MEMEMETEMETETETHEGRCKINSLGGRDRQRQRQRPAGRDRQAEAEAEAVVETETGAWRVGGRKEASIGVSLMYSSIFRHNGGSGSDVGLTCRSPRLVLEHVPTALPWLILILCWFWFDDLAFWRQMLPPCSCYVPHDTRCRGKLRNDLPNA
eukprot:749303-Hanusia_phi.AAC.6